MTTDPFTKIGTVGIHRPAWSDGSPYSTGEAYDYSQTSDRVKDGDVIVAEHDGRTVAAVMVEAWPVAFDGIDEDQNAGEFHVMDHPAQWDTLDDGKYLPSIAAYSSLPECDVALGDRVLVSRERGDDLPGRIVEIRRNHEYRWIVFVEVDADFDQGVPMPVSHVNTYVECVRKEVPA